MVKKIDFLLITRGVLAISVIIWHVEGYKENFGHYLTYQEEQLSFYFLLFGFYLLLAYFNRIDSRNLFGNLIHFFSGILFCKYTKDYGVPKISNGLLGLLILVLITISNYFYHTFGYAYFTLGLLMINSCIPLLIILHHNLNEILFQDKNLLGSSFLNFGTISFGIYAWHPLVIKLMEKYNNLNLIPIVILTITIAYVSYNFFEKPVLSYGTKKK